MLYSKLFGKTVKEPPSDAKSASHKLLHQAGFTRESTAGRYYFLPLGQRVQLKIIDVIRDEMNKAGAEEMLTPLLHPLSLWKETNRNKSAGYELMIVKDRREAEFALGGTAEEMFVDVLRKFQLSYKDLPFNVYQFSAKFRDELRARGGLLRVREFIMKDAYSFHATEDDFKKEYKNMQDTYSRIFNRLGLETHIVEAANGYIGGDYSHEFQFACEVGEDTIFKDPSTGELYNKEIAPVKAPAISDPNEEERPKQDVEGKGIIGVVELAKYLKIPVEKTTKTLIFENEKGEIIAAAVRGGYDVSETKLKKILGCQILVLASEKTVKNVTNAEVGYAGLLNLPKTVKVVMDESMKDRKNFEMGANRTNFHTINVNFGRDLDEPKEFYEIKQAKEGDKHPSDQVYETFRGIEVGNVFQLGYYYSSKMKGAVFTDKDGKEKSYYMGCYGIGIGRTMAAMVEKYHDEKGIIWPENVAPFQVHLVGLNLEDKEVKKKADSVYPKLNDAHIEVLYDDRETVSAGEKFADADLIGIPHRLVVSKKTGEKIEYKKRSEKESQLLKLEEVVDIIRK